MVETLPGNRLLTLGASAQLRDKGVHTAQPLRNCFALPCPGARGQCSAWQQTAGTGGAAIPLGYSVSAPHCLGKYSCRLGRSSPLSGEGTPCRLGTGDSLSHLLRETLRCYLLPAQSRRQ